MPEGEIFEYPITRIAHFTDTHERCPVCGLRYEVEPGFFYGAMYISYGMTVGFMVTMLIAIFVLGNDPDLWVYLAIIIPLNLLCVPLFFVMPGC